MRIRISRGLDDTEASERAVNAARCHEVQTALGTREVPEFEAIVEIGMAVRLALHVRGLASVDYEILKRVASHFLGIPRLAVDRIVEILAEVEFLRPVSTGDTIEKIIPTVPYYDDLYEILGEYLAERSLTEAEELTITMVNRLASAPENEQRLLNDLGAEPRQFRRSIEIGTKGTFLIRRRCRGRDILINPSYFAENAKIFADHVASTNSETVQNIIDKLRAFQGWPLSLIRERNSIGSLGVEASELELLKRLAQDGVVKPPSITTEHSGKNYFMFTPSPGPAQLSPTKREIYEKAMAIVAAVRQGQLLPQRYAIRSPGAVLYTLRNELKLGRSTTEFSHQYSNLVHLRVGQLIDVGNNFSEFRIIDTKENRQALDTAYSLVAEGKSRGFEVDDQARKALQSDQRYVDSIIASSEIRERETVGLSEEDSRQLELLLLKGSGND